ncbi:MAG: hypothetical protein CME19_16975 [Gemmatimonadetes bacterium]|nr:hypothetical protein [Gemmatimonadota bacterium]
MTNGQTDLLELIQYASESSEGLVRMDAVRRLKRRSLQRLDALALSEFARKAEDPAWRTTAAQVLGFHRIACNYPDLVGPLKGAAAAEQDPEARRALVYAIRDTDGASDLLDHPLIDVAGEAIAGVPRSEVAWHRMLDAYFSGLSPNLEHRILRLVRGPDESADWVVKYLLMSSFEQATDDPTEKAGLLLQHIDQGRALSALLAADDRLNRTHQEIWPGLARRERKRVLLELFTRGVAEAGLETNLAEVLVDRVRQDPDYVGKHGRNLRALLKALSPRDGEQLTLVAAHAFDEAESKARIRLADLMMMVAKELPNTTETVGKILADWKEAPPELLLKLRQTRMGIR